MQRNDEARGRRRCRVRGTAAAFHPVLLDCGHCRRGRRAAVRRLQGNHAAVRRLPVAATHGLQPAGAGPSALPGRLPPAEEFVERRARVFDAIGRDALAIVQGAAGVDGFKVFRQSNEFYYLTGTRKPARLPGARWAEPQGHAVSGPSRTRRWNEVTAPRWSRPKTPPTVQAPDRRRSGRRPSSSCPQPDPSARLLPAAAPGALRALQARPKARRRAATNCSPTRPAVAGDPWDGRPSREAHFIGLLARSLPRPSNERDLTPVLDAPPAT